MGTGFSRKKKQITRSTQVTSSPFKVRPSTPPPSKPRRTSDHYQRRPYSSPRDNKDDQLTTDPYLAHYDSIWDSNGKLTSTFDKLIRTGSIQIEHQQQVTDQNENLTKHQSTYESAQVESIFQSHIETLHQLSTSEQLDTLMMNLKQTHLNFDQTIKQRIEQITNETESILSQIVEETQMSQQQLLINAKEQQIIHEEQYRSLLDDFIRQLNDKRAKQLAQIQEQLQQQRLLIFNQSKQKIRALHRQASQIKTQIIQQEEQTSSTQVDTIVQQIETISTESALQNIGALFKSNFNISITENLGLQSQQNSIKRTVFLENNQTSSTLTQVKVQQENLHQRSSKPK